MKKTSKSLIFGLLIIIVALTILIKFAELEKITKLFLQANYFFIFAAMLAQLVVFLFVAKVYQIIFEGFSGLKARLKEFYKTAIVVLFLNQALPSMGFSGNTFLFSAFKKNDVKAGKNIFMVIFNLFVLYTSYLISITLTILYLLFKGGLTKLQLTAAIIMGIATLFLLIIASFIVKKASRIRKVLKLVSVFFPVGELEADEIVSELLSGKKQIARERKIYLKSVITRICSFLAECVTILMTFWAFKINVNFISIITAYLVATLFALITFIPCGLGVFETTMILTFKGFGIPYEAALIATLAYRGFAFWLPMPLGLWLYRHSSSPIEHC